MSRKQKKQRIPEPGDLPYWRRKLLSEMTPAEWEALCDGCGRCCLIKLEDEDTGEIVHTRVACRLLDIDTCRCSKYEQRRDDVPDCIQITEEGARTLPWLPETCAYRLVALGYDLEWWHPLVAGSARVMHEAGVTVTEYAISEDDVEDGAFENFLLKWVD